MRIMRVVMKQAISRKSRNIFVVAFLFFCSLTFACASSGVITKPADILLDGTVVGNVNVGQTVVILGRNDETGEILVSVAGSGDQPVVGLIPGDCVLDQSNVVNPAQRQQDTHSKSENPSPSRTSPPVDDSDPFSPAKVWTAAELSEFIRDNRESFADFRGKKVSVSGVVSEARMEGRGERLKVSIGLQTPPTMPRVKVEMSPTYMQSAALRKRFSFEERESSFYTPGINFRNTREGINAQVVWEYKSTYTTSGRRTHEYGYKKESAWQPVVTVNSTVTISAVLSDNRFEITLTDGEFVD
jgi:hypothetical protein